MTTNMAGRGTDIPLAPGVAQRGGLHVICCQHNASPRIDRQLQGRAARQGDPGSVETILCLEDGLLARSFPGLAARRWRGSADGGRPLPGWIGRSAGLVSAAAGGAAPARRAPLAAGAGRARRRAAVLRGARRIAAPGKNQRGPSPARGRERARGPRAEAPSSRIQRQQT